MQLINRRVATNQSASCISVNDYVRYWFLVGCKWGLSDANLALYFILEIDVLQDKCRVGLTTDLVLDELQQYFDRKLIFLKL